MSHERLTYSRVICAARWGPLTSNCITVNASSCHVVALPCSTNAAASHTSLTSHTSHTSHTSLTSSSHTSLTSTSASLLLVRSASRCAAHQNNPLFGTHQQL